MTERRLPQRILLVDADAFFAAVARLVDPLGAGRAELLIVGGAPGSRGVVCSASYEARRFGVRSAMPISQALRLCPQAMCVPVPRRACGEKSHAIATVLARYTPIVQSASIDEWYLDLSGTERLYRGAELADVARRIRDDVLAETSISVSLGGGTTRLVAKLAVEVAKPKPGTDGTGVHVVAPGGEGRFMERFDLADIPHIGPRFRDRLASFGLRTVLDVLKYDVQTLSGWIGSGEAAWLWARVRGIDESRVVARKHAKSLSREETFDRDLAGDEELERELLRLVTRVATDLRGDELSARTITVKLRDSDFRTRQARRTLAEGVIADRVIFETARELLHRLRRQRRTPARLLGVALTTLDAPDFDAQLTLFSHAVADVETERDRVLARAVDRLRERFGNAVVVPGRLTRPPER